MYYNLILFIFYYYLIKKNNKIMMYNANNIDNLAYNQTNYTETNKNVKNSDCAMIPKKSLPKNWHF